MYSHLLTVVLKASTSEEEQLKQNAFQKLLGSEWVKVEEVSGVQENKAKSEVNFVRGAWAGDQSDRVSVAHQKDQAGQRVDDALEEQSQWGNSAVYVKKDKRPGPLEQASEVWELYEKIK